MAGVLFKNNKSSISAPPSTKGGVLFRSSQPAETKIPLTELEQEEWDRVNLPQPIQYADKSFTETPKPTIGQSIKGGLLKGLGIVGKVFGTPNDIVMNTSKNITNLVTGKPLQYKSGYSYTDYIKDQTGADVNNIKNPVIRGAVTGLANTAADITTYIGGGIADDLARAGKFGVKALPSTTENLMLNANRNINAVKKLPFTKASEAVENVAKVTDMPKNNSMLDMLRKSTGFDTPQIKKTQDIAENINTSIKPKAFIEPDIPIVKKERGFSVNIRTDLNNPDALRDSFTTNPLSYEQLANKDTLARAQKIFDNGYESARTQVSELASQMKAESVPLAKMLARQAMETGNTQGAREILSDVAEKLTQAGQFSQAAKLLRESDPETFLMTIGKQLKKLNKEGLEIYGNKWKNFDLTPNELNAVSQIERGNQLAYESVFETIQKRIANEMPASAMEKVNAWRHMSMLLNPKTHIRNVTGNAIMMGMRKVAQRVSGVAQKVLKAEDRTQAVFINKDYKKAARDYFEANKKELLSGASKYNENLTLNMPGKRVFKTGPLEATRNFNYKLLELGDTPFFKNAYVDRLSSYAQAKGIKDFSKLGQEAFDIARREAEQATYKDASLVASFLNKMKNPGKNANLGQKVGAALTEAALPFTKTPINIIKRGIQYSPAGIINGLSKIRSAEGAAAAIDEMAKGLTGTGILSLGYLLARKGVLTGKAENDKDLAEYDRNTGNSPFSILGKYTYDWAQPFAVPLTVGVEIYNAVKDSPEETKKLDALIQKNESSQWEETAKKFASGIMNSFNASGDTVFDMSIMKGIRNLLGSGYKGFMEGLAQTPQNYAMQFIPTAASQVAGQIDPVVRQSYIKGNPIESAKATALSKIPFASKALQPKQTPWGEDVKRVENPLLRAFSQFISPGNVTVPQNIDPAVDSELRRLNKMGETIQFPRVAANSFTWKGQQFNLTPEEYTQFQKTVGQNTLEAYKEYIKTSEYKSLNDSDKAKELSDIITDAQNLAKFQIIQSKDLANSPEIMSVPNSFTINKKEYPMTFEQQNELADLINKYKKQYGSNKNITPESIEQAAKDRAYAEMKAKLYKNE